MHHNFDQMESVKNIRHECVAPFSKVSVAVEYFFVRNIIYTKERTVYFETSTFEIGLAHCILVWNFRENQSETSNLDIIRSMFIIFKYNYRLFYKIRFNRV